MPKTPVTLVGDSTKKKKTGKAASSEAEDLNESDDLNQTVPEEMQLCAEDFGEDGGKQLLLVKLPPGIDVTSLVGKKVSVKRNRVSAFVRRRGRRVEAELSVDFQPSTKEHNGWSLFLPSKNDAEGYHLVNQPLEGSFTLNYTIFDVRETEKNVEQPEEN